MLEVISAIRWATGVICLGVFGYAAVANVVILYRAWFLNGKSSLIPVVGGLFGMLGLLIMPSGKLIWFAWVPLLMDIGCLPMIVGGILEGPGKGDVSGDDAEEDNQ